MGAGWQCGMCSVVQVHNLKPPGSEGYQPQTVTIRTSQFQINFVLKVSELKLMVISC